MALIEVDNPAAIGTTLQYWQDQLTNTRILLFELDKAILILTRDERENYTLDTGQTTVTVRHVNLPELINRRASLLKQAQEIEATIDNFVNTGASFTQVVPF